MFLHKLCTISNSSWFKKAVWFGKLSVLILWFISLSLQERLRLFLGQFWMLLVAWRASPSLSVLLGGRERCSPEEGWREETCCQVHALFVVSSTLWNTSLRGNQWSCIAVAVANWPDKAWLEMAQGTTLSWYPQWLEIRICENFIGSANP